MGFPDFPIPENEKSYLPSKDMLAFLQLYSDKHGVTEHIKVFIALTIHFFGKCSKFLGRPVARCDELCKTAGRCWMRLAVTEHYGAHCIWSSIYKYIRHKV